MFIAEWNAASLRYVVMSWNLFVLDQILFELPFY